MINQYQLPALLRQEIPALSICLFSGKTHSETYAFLHSFINYTRDAVKKHNLRLAKKCFDLADRIYCNGDRLVKVLIENNFVYSISSLLPDDASERLKVRAVIPNRLYAMYVRQVMQSGC